MNQLWKIPCDLLQTSITIMRPHGKLGHEGLALWFGNCDGNITEITHVVSVCGPGFHTSPLNMRISLRGFEALTNLADRLNAYLVGQIHSHPESMLELSEADIAYGIRRQDYLSAVCPHYAQYDIGSIEDCGVHVFDRGTYRRFSELEIARHLHQTNERIVLVSCELPA